ncbi:MAG: thioredoxin domain-containing protein [Candidatus Diapherotrites archaeon]
MGLHIDRGILVLAASAAAAAFLYSFVFWQAYPPIYNANSPQVGSDAARFDAVVFLDYSALSNAVFVRGVIEPVIKDYRGSVRFVFKVLPTDSRCNPETNSEAVSCTMAEALLCAHAQGKYFEYAGTVVDLMLASAKDMPESAGQQVVYNFSEEEAGLLAAAVGLDRERLAACIKGHDALPEIRNNAIEGRLYYLEHVPWVLVNRSAVPFHEGATVQESYLLLKGAIEKELNKNG